MELRYKREHLKYILMLFPFFEPYSISMLAEGSSFWNIISLAFTASRYLVSLIVIIGYIRNRNKPHSTTGILCIGFTVVRIIASTINSTIYTTFFISLFTYIGIILLCEKMLHAKKNDLIYEVFTSLFAIFSFAAFITIVLLPNGFNHALYKTDAIYFLGSKNSSFYYFYVFLCAWILRTIANYKINNKKTTFYTLLMFTMFLSAAIICDSSNSFGSLLILLMFYMLVRFSHLLYKLAKPSVLLFIIVTVAVLLIFRNNIPLFNVVFSILGRDGSITGRDYIWMQQIDLVKNNPIWGNGIGVKTVLRSNAIATHAHNFYLDTIVKYGAVSLVTLLILIISSIRNVARMSNAKYKTFFAGTLFTLFIHNIFDDVSLYLLFAVLMFTEFKYTSIKGMVKI